MVIEVAAQDREQRSVIARLWPGCPNHGGLTFPSDDPSVTGPIRKNAGFKPALLNIGEICFAGSWFSGKASALGRAFNRKWFLPR